MRKKLPLNATEIHANLSTISKALLSQLDVFTEIDSTNTYLMTQAQTDVLVGTACFTEFQTAGKGRRGRQWISPRGQNICGSFLWKFYDVSKLNGLSLAIGIGVIRALTKQGISNLGLKWANDIYSDGKKLGGILIEATTHSNGSASVVVGVGLNLQLPSEIEAITQPYTDLQTVAPEFTSNRNVLIASLLNELLPIAATFEKQGLSAYLKEWCEFDCLTDKTVTLFANSQQIEGIVRGIDENGLLKLELKNGKIQTFSSGEVSFSA
jgi:BirA family transcriptional regulator, biotin operon repressor / biotin---[acetyl-CoA-carboxylase] ligase